MIWTTGGALASVMRVTEEVSQCAGVELPSSATAFIAFTRLGDGDGAKICEEADSSSVRRNVWDVNTDGLENEGSTVVGVL